jgi:hypothetical protein
MLKLLSEINQKVDSQNQILNSHTQSITKLEANMEQIANQIEEEELWSQFEASPKELYMIDDDDSSSSRDELIQANRSLRSERIIDHEMEERKNELVLTFEPPKDPIPHPVPLEMEYTLKDQFLQDLEEPFEKIGVKLNIFHAA